MTLNPLRTCLYKVLYCGMGNHELSCAIPGEVVYAIVMVV